MPERSVAVLVATFRRPDGLAGLLDALDAVVAAPPPGCRVRVVVCDNDPDASARAVCAGRVAYVHEPAPGIAAARNALLEAASDVDLVAFIDDDEWPEVGWLDALVATSDRFAADVVTGPVVSDFDEPVTPALVRSFERPRQATGTAVAWPRTGNVLLRRAALEGPPLRFRDSYGLSGGSDSMLFLELGRRGAAMVWSDEAVVHERVPASRTTLRWVVRRAFRLGNTHTRFDRDLDGRPRTMTARAVKALAWIGTGVLAGIVAAARRDGAGVVGGLERVARGAGMLAAFGGVRFVEYARAS